MYSSTMRTARSLTVSRSVLGGGVLHQGETGQTPRMQTPWDTDPFPPPPWIEGMTHVCENITFPQLLLRAVIISSVYPKCDVVKDIC